MGIEASRAVLARLDEMLTKVPPRVAHGPYNLSVDFKKAIVAARKVRNKRGLQEWEAQVAINNIDTQFWKGPA